MQVFVFSDICKTSSSRLCGSTNKGKCEQLHCVVIGEMDCALGLLLYSVFGCLFVRCTHPAVDLFRFIITGLKAGDRTEVQTEWMQGKVLVIVATISFGMGVDKANVR